MFSFFWKLSSKIIILFQEIIHCIFICVMELQIMQNLLIFLKILFIIHLLDVLQFTEHTMSRFVY
jgi:hypothetical protein